jgi:hypothetical protein
MICGPHLFCGEFIELFVAKTALAQGLGFRYEYEQNQLNKLQHFCNQGLRLIATKSYIEVYA